MNPNGKIVWQDGRPSYVLQDQNLTIIMGYPLNYSASLHAVYLQIRQDGETQVDIDPSKFSAVAQDGDRTDLPYLDMDKKAAHDKKRRSVVGGILMGIAAGASGAAAGAPQTAAVNNSDGTSSTITYTDPNAQAAANSQAAQNAANMRANIDSRYAAQTKQLLRHTTSQRGVVVEGYVYFQGPKHMKPTVKNFTPVDTVNIVLNDTTYKF